MTDNTRPTKPVAMKGLGFDSKSGGFTTLILGEKEYTRSEVIAALAAKNAEIAALRDALGWYADKVAGCRKATSEGDEARYVLHLDGGKRARDALAEKV